MKLKTSFFNVSALRKNLTRFAPAWGLYGLALVLVVLNISDQAGLNFARMMGYSISIMAVVNFCYALLCALLLFGDLYNSRICNALHAMPMRREGWFLTNVVSGLLFSLIPNTVVALLGVILSEELWMFPLLWLGAVTMQFLFFFGVAVFSGYLVGNRVALALVYYILNGFSPILYLLIQSIFEPMLYGVTVQREWFVEFCPVEKMIDTVYLAVFDVIDTPGQWPWEFIDGWGYMGICAGLGVVALGVALLCYRKRNLEAAGDFAATKPIGIGFLILYTICGGACCHSFFSLFLGDENEWFLYLGLAIGFFTGMMLLKRTVRVFKLKNFLGFGTVVLAMILSVIVVRTDLLGIVRWMPKAEQIKSVSITTDGTADYRNRQLTLTEAGDLENILQIHQYGLQNRDADIDGRRDARVILTYTLKNGTVRHREYYVNVDTPCGDMIRQYISRPEMVLGDVYDMLDTHTLVGVEIQKEEIFVVKEEVLQQLMDAILADCAEGNLPQDWGYTDGYGEAIWLGLQFISNKGQHYYTDILFTSQAKHLTAWLKSIETVQAQAKPAIE